MDTFDLIFVSCAVLFNWLIVGVLITTKRDCPRWRTRFGAAFVILGIPFTAIFVHYLLDGRDAKIMLMLAGILLYIAVEFMLDYVLKTDFRSKPLMHIPYIILEYVALFSLIGISFSIDRMCGWIVAISFWAVLGSLIYVYGIGRTSSAPARH